MLNVCVSASDPDYATCGDVMAVLFGSTTTGNVATTQEMDQISRTIRRASAWAESVLGQPLALQTYQETVPGFGGRALLLARTPIVAVLRLFDSTSTASATEYCSTHYSVEDRDAGVLARDAGWPWSNAAQYASDFSLGLTAARLPGMESRPWLVEYVAGYTILATTSTCHGRSTADETWTTGPTLPEDIKQAVILKAVEFQSNPLGVRSRKVGDLAVEYATAGLTGRGGLVSAAEALLAPYRRID